MAYGIQISRYYSFKAKNVTYFVRILVHPAGVLVTPVSTVGLLVAEQVLGNALPCRRIKTGFVKGLVSNAREQIFIPTGPSRL